MFAFKIEKNGLVLDVELEGRLSAVEAPEVIEEMKKYVGMRLEKIVYHVEKLDYIASAGIRVIIFSKQKIGKNMQIFMEKPCDMVRSVLDMTGLNMFVTII